MSESSARELLRQDGGYADGFWADVDLSESEFIEKHHAEVARRLACPSVDEVRDVCVGIHLLMQATSAEARPAAETAEA